MTTGSPLRKSLALLCLLAVGSGLLAALQLSRPAAQPERPAQPPSAAADLEVSGVRYTEIRDGLKRWTLQADAATHQLDAGLTDIQQLAMTFYDAQGRQQLQLQARQGNVDTRRQTVVARGDVRLQTPEGLVLRVEQLDYQATTGLVSSAGRVRVTAPDWEMTGTGLVFDLQRHSFQLQHQVQAQVSGALLEKRR